MAFIISADSVEKSRLRITRQRNNLTKRRETRRSLASWQGRKRGLLRDRWETRVVRIRPDSALPVFVLVIARKYRLYPRSDFALAITRRRIGVNHSSASERDVSSISLDYANRERRATCFPIPARLRVLRCTCHLRKYFPRNLRRQQSAYNKLSISLRRDTDALPTEAYIFFDKTVDFGKNWLASAWEICIPTDRGLSRRLSVKGLALEDREAI